jgi:hypothetical protein
MELSQIFLAVIGMACAVLGWLAREMYSAMQALRQDLGRLEVQLTRDYVRYDRLQDAFKPVLDALAEIKHTLQGKVDK